MFLQEIKPFSAEAEKAAFFIYEAAGV